MLMTCRSYRQRAGRKAMHGSFCLLLNYLEYFLVLKVKAICSSETVVNVWQTTLRPIFKH
jgi:hypothetical protein